jgi:hypothetical protein
MGQALLSLCQFMEYDEAEALLRDEGVDPNAAYEDGTTGLHMAAYNDSVEWAGLCKFRPQVYFSILTSAPFNSTATRC